MSRICHPETGHGDKTGIHNNQPRGFVSERPGFPRLSWLRGSRFARPGMPLGAALAVILGISLSAFALNFPPLTGSVVDQAGVMTPQSRTDIEAKSKDLEDKSGIQLVVATAKSLQGSDVETYANQLFRFWKLGEAKKNNGVLLLVAPAEHKVRVEVGYGLEGTLTDALTSVIIASAIVPRFKANDYSGGIERGVDGIISVLNGDTTDWQPKVEVREDSPAQVFNALFPILFFLFFILFFRFMVGPTRGTPSGYYVRRNGQLVFVPYTGSSWSSGSSWGGGGGGGFSSGGGL